VSFGVWWVCMQACKKPAKTLLNETLPSNMFFDFKMKFSTLELACFGVTLLPENNASYRCVFTQDELSDDRRYRRRRHSNEAMTWSPSKREPDIQHKKKCHTPEHTGLTLYFVTYLCFHWYRGCVWNCMLHDS